MPDLWANDMFVADLKKDLGENKHKNTKFSKMMFKYGRLILVNKLLDVKKGDIVLDIGCADGFLLGYHQDLISPFGVDISKTMIKNARKNVVDGAFFISTMENLPFKEETFDKIVAVYSFIYSDNKHTAIKEISRVLKNGGSFIVYDPNKLSLRTFIRLIQSLKFRLMRETENSRYFHHRFVTKNALTYWKFKEMGKSSGFILKEWYGIFSLHLILQSTLFHSVLDTLKYKKWGSLPLLKYFSDFLIIQYIKLGDSSKTTTKINSCDRTGE